MTFLCFTGNSYYSSDSNTSTPAGFKQYCVPIPLAPGWHKVELRYTKSPLDRTSVFRFFVVDAEQVCTLLVDLRRKSAAIMTVFPVLMSWF